MAALHNQSCSLQTSLLSHTLTDNIALCAGTLCKSKHRFSERYVESVPLDLVLLFQHSNNETTRITSDISLLSFFYLFSLAFLQLLLIFMAGHQIAFSVTAHIRHKLERVKGEMQKCANYQKAVQGALIKTAAVCIAIISHQPAPQLRSSFDCFSSHYRSLVNVC